MAQFDAAFVQQILHLPEREREPDIQHHRQADDVGAGFEILKWVTFCDSQTLVQRPAHLKLVSSDKACAAAERAGCGSQTQTSARIGFTRTVWFHG